MHDWQSEVRARLKPLNLKPEREADIVDEIAQHLAERYREAVSGGATREEATRLALAEFHGGNVLARRIAALEQAHAPAAAVTLGASTGNLLADFWHDLRYSVRMFAKHRTFAATAILILALGIGATTAIFSIVYSVLIKPLPYPHAEELVRLRHSFGGELGGADFEPTMYVTFRDENRTLVNIGLWQDASVTLSGHGEPEQLRGIRVTDGTLQTLGVQPLRGRWFTADEHGPAAEGSEPVIISYGFWQRRFGGEDVIGRGIVLDSRPARIVGIMPPDFRFLDYTPPPDVIAAVRLDEAKLITKIGMSYQGIGRLKPGVTPDEARADLDRMRPIWIESWPLVDIPGATREALAAFPIAAVVRPLKDDIVGGVASMLWVLMGAIGAVLFVACANIANLTLVRADARRQEFAVRAALGAGTARIARALLVENLALGVAGGVLGLLVAYAGLELLVALGPSNLPRLDEIGIHAPVFAFTVAISLLSTLLFGSLAVLKTATRSAAPLTGTARAATTSRERNRARSTLVVVQVALALALVVSAGLMIRTFQELRDVDPGFAEPATVQTARIWMPRELTDRPEQYTRLQHEILDRIATVPGVAAVGFASALPMEGPGWSGNSPIVIEGQVLPAGAVPTSRANKFVSPGYFAAMGTRFIAGRDITWGDIETGGRVVIISERFAREIEGEPAAAVGKRIRTFAESDAWREIVGVVQDVHETNLYADATSFVYFPALVADMWGSPRVGAPNVAFAIRSNRAGTAGFINEVRQAVWSVNGSLPVTHSRTMSDLYSGSLERTSFVLVLLAIAGAMALVLGIVGIYAVVAYVIAQRTREIGIRSALGAEPKQLARMFLLRGLALSVAGAVAGLVGAGVLGRLMSSLLFGVGPLDPVVYVAALAVTIAAATLASYVPARRAAKVDPMNTLRAE